MRWTHVLVAFVSVLLGYYIAAYVGVLCVLVGLFAVCTADAISKALARYRARRAFRQWRRELLTNPILFVGPPGHGKSEPRTLDFSAIKLPDESSLREALKVTKPGADHAAS